MLKNKASNLKAYPLQLHMQKKQMVSGLVIFTHRPTATLLAPLLRVYHVWIFMTKVRKWNHKLEDHPKLEHTLELL
jgi:hypothetical protein